MNQDGKVLRGQRPRSPSYPGISLKEAIERVTTVYNKDFKNESSEVTILDHWGYQPRSGAGLVTLAAVKAFGLLIPGKPGALKVSNLALRIILDKRPDSQERAEAIFIAALQPPVHKIMWEKYGKNLPSDTSIMFFLEKEKQFTHNGAQLFIAQYRETIGFANLLADNALSEGQIEETPPGKQMLEMPTTSASTVKMSIPGGLKQIPIPIPGASWPMLVADFPLTEQAWAAMMELLKAMKPGLVADKKADEEKPE